jgi:2-keto-4-pentenoate hydratase/2-oxohepta-3-ene-1,7-dioic acid hydratase in catechol pathway
LRDWSKRGLQNMPSKNFFHSGALGPWIATADEIPDPQALRLTTRRNGETVQDGTTDRMIFTVAFLIAYMSKFTWLEPGDVISTGSPGGSITESDVPQWLRPGETLEIEVPGIGALRHGIAEE